MILTQVQAEAVYNAMYALNGVGVVNGDLMFGEGCKVQWLKRVTMREGLSGHIEEYPSRIAFAAAYNLK